MKIDLNKLAARVTIEEGGVVSVNVAQVKEVIRITLKLLSKHNIFEIIQLIRRIRKAK